jgi:hypothetical protein
VLHNFSQKHFTSSTAYFLSFAFPKLCQPTTRILTTGMSVQNKIPDTHSHPISRKMATEEFQQIMARLRAREQDLNETFAAAEEEFRDYAHDHRNFIAAVEADQGTTPVTQHPVTEALNAFSSTQVVAAPAPTSDTDVPMDDAEESLFIPQNPVPGSDTDAKMTDTGRSLSLLVELPTNELSSLLLPQSRPKRRVTFADSATVIAGMTSSPGTSEHGQQSSTAESIALKVPSDDAHLRYTKPQSTGNEFKSKDIH